VLSTPVLSWQNNPRSWQRTFARDHGRRATLTGLDMSHSELIEAPYMDCIPIGNVNGM
jgi:hypothetical protein